MTFYARLQATANRLLKGKGQSITLTKITAGTYNPATGGFTGAGTSTQTAYGAVFDYGAKQIDGTLIKAGDKQLLLSAFKTDGAALTAPVLGDTVSIGGGDVYASVFNGDIYKQAGGIGDFMALGQTSRNRFGMAVAPNGDVYASVYSGDIYKQAGGAGAFVALGQTSRLWVGMAASPNGDVYACEANGDIYKQTGGIGDFMALGQTSRNWYGMAASPNGDVYASVHNGDIYKQAGGIGDFVGLSQTTRTWGGMAVAPNVDYKLREHSREINKE